MPAMGDMQRAGGIGRDEFHLHTLSGAGIRSAVAGALLQDLADLSMVGVILEEEIDESSAGYFHFRERRARRMPPCQSFGELSGILPGGHHPTHTEYASQAPIRPNARVLNADPHLTPGSP